MNCPHCGKENVDRAPFCASCGKKLTYVEKGEAAEPASPAIEAVSAEEITVQTEAPGEVARSVTPGTGEVFIPPLASVDPASASAQPSATAAAPMQAGVVHIPAQAATEEASASGDTPTGVASSGEQGASPAQSSMVSIPLQADALSTGAPSQPSAPNAQAVSAGSSQATASSATPSQSTSAGAPGYQAPPGAHAQVPPVQTAPSVGGGATPPPMTGGNVIYAKGCMGAAWSDITGSQGWFGRILLLGLINIVPILNWVVTGYAMRWSRKLSLGDLGTMPTRIFGDRNFINGAFAFVVSLVVSIVVGVVGGILGLLPLLGTLVVLAISLFLTMFQYLAIMRSALADRLGPAFDISKVWEVMKRKSGQMFCATLLPGIIVGAIVSVVAIIVCMLFLIPMMGELMTIMAAATDGYYTMPYGHSAASSLYLTMRILMLMMPMLIVCYIIGCFADALATVWTYRATGHYIARYAADWAALANNPYYYYK